MKKMVLILPKWSRRGKWVQNEVKVTRPCVYKADSAVCIVEKKKTDVKKLEF